MVCLMREYHLTEKLFDGVMQKSQTDEGKHFHDEFDGDALKKDWNFIYNTTSKYAALDKTKGLLLYGTKEPIISSGEIAWVGYRQKHHEFMAETHIDLPIWRMAVKQALQYI